MKEILEKIKKIDYKALIKKVSKEKNKYGFYAIVGIIGIQLIGSIVYAILIYFNVSSLDQKLTELGNLSLYHIETKDLGELKDDTVYSVFDVYDGIVKDKDNLEERFENFQAPYNYFLKSIYLPSLNIWKSDFSTGINTNLVGQYFLNKNPYLDINLLSTWGNFFKNASDGVIANNTISNINIGDILEKKDGKFSIQIDVKFSSPTRRSFLMLINKLSITSNKKNISLFNEFMYNIFEEIKKQQSENFKKLGVKDYDAEIGKNLYVWINSDSTTELKNNYISEDIINKAIQKTAKCDTKTDMNECLFKFRDKYNSLPTLAYTVGNGKNTTKTASLKKFLVEMPPLLNVTKFTFRKQPDPINIGNYEYQGEITIEVYGRSLTEKDLGDIVDTLGESCIKTPDMKDKKQYSLSLDNIMMFVNNKINLVSQSKDTIDTTVLKDINDIKVILEDYKKQYKELSNYKKAIKSFEIYRMLKENNLCI